MHAAQKAAAKREAARTRKKLFEGASEVSGENETESANALSGVTGRDEDDTGQRDQKHRGTGGSEQPSNSISDWA
jgi:hypothetical protein